MEKNLGLFLLAANEWDKIRNEAERNVCQISMQYCWYRSQGQTRTCTYIHTPTLSSLPFCSFVHLLRTLLTWRHSQSHLRVLHLLSMPNKHSRYYEQCYKHPVGGMTDPPNKQAVYAGSEAYCVTKVHGHLLRCPQESRKSGCGIEPSLQRTMTQSTCMIPIGRLVPKAFV
jgi:hypothetical protein